MSTHAVIALFLVDIKPSHYKYKNIYTNFEELSDFLYKERWVASGPSEEQIDLLDSRER